MALRLVVDATIEPVTLDEVKIALKMDTATSVEDALLNSYIKVARIECEGKTGRALVPQTWELTMDAFPSGGIQLHYPPLSTSTASVRIEYINSSGSTASMDTTSISLDWDSEPAWAFPLYGESWPIPLATPNAVRVQFDCGYKISGTAVTTPEPLKTWIKMRVGSLYENREHITPRSEEMLELPRSAFDALLDRYYIVEDL